MQVVADQPANLAGARHVAAHFGKVIRIRAAELTRHDHVAAKARFGDLRITHVGREQREHTRAIHAGDEEHVIGRVTQVVHERLVVDVAVALPAQTHEDRIRARKGARIAVEHLHIRVLHRDHLVEPGIEPQARRGTTQCDGHREAQRQQDAPVPHDGVGATLDKAGQAGRRRTGRCVHDASHGKATAKQREARRAWRISGRRARYGMSANESARSGR